MANLHTGSSETLARVDWAELNRQRAAVLAASNSCDEQLISALEGVLNLLDELCDEAELAGMFSPSERRQWWREGCLASGLGDPEQVEVL